MEARFQHAPGGARIQRCLSSKLAVLSRTAAEATRNSFGSIRFYRFPFFPPFTTFKPQNMNAVNRTAG
jgi:hypothetical protein